MEQWQQEAPAGREPALIPVGARVVRRCLLHLAVLIICCTPLPPLVGSSIGMEMVCQCAGRPALPRRRRRQGVLLSAAAAQPTS